VRSYVPKPQQTVLIGDDAHLLAELSAILARRRAYLPVLDGPRIHRPDLDHEVIRRNNAVALIKPEKFLLAGLPASICDLFAPYFHVAQRTLTWGRNRVGLGLCALSKIDSGSLSTTLNRHQKVFDLTVLFLHLLTTLADSSVPAAPVPSSPNLASYAKTMSASWKSLFQRPANLYRTRRPLVGLASTFCLEISLPSGPYSFTLT
jgi:hypothetical protein